MRLRAQTRPLASLDEVIVVHDGLAEAARARLEATAGRGLTFVRLDAGDDYYAAKDAGFAATRAAVVAFADADCWPDPDWLRALLEPFARDAAVGAVAGRTSYRPDMFGAAATAIDFMYFGSPLAAPARSAGSRRSEKNNSRTPRLWRGATAAGCTRNFYANNVAFRREVLTDAPLAFGAHGFYRGSCQVLGLALQARGIAIHFAPRAHTVHRLPDSIADLVRLRLLRGADSVELAPHLADAYLPARARRLGRLGPLSGLAVLAARWGCSLLALQRQGSPAVRGPRWFAGAALVSAIHAADAAGAVIRGLRLGLAPPARARALGYHGNVDRLAA
ncbi:MAG TPA: glycosyltransferase [Polyangia bacterium]|jgi:glycosyltransferase involved in cell wall biosynthesis